MRCCGLDNVKPLYKYEDWQVTEEEFKVKNNHHNETIFAQGNGYIGIRGIFEEDYSGPAYSTTPGIYINGVYASEDIIYGEKIPKLPKKTQMIVNLADWTSINLYLENEKFDMLKGKVENYKRTLNMKKGILSRQLVWTSPAGKKIELKITRLLSFINHHQGIIDYRVKPVNFTGKIRIVSALNGKVKNYHHMRNKKPLKVIDRDKENNNLYLIQETTNTKINIGFIMRNLISVNDDTASELKRNYQVKEEKIYEDIILNVTKGQEIVFNKYVYFYSSEGKSYLSNDEEIKQGIKSIDTAVKKGYYAQLEEQQLFLKDYWNNADIKIEGDKALQQAFRFNAFHLLQSTGRGGSRNVAAKGLTGEYYEGHYFWDTETYTIPYFLYSQPKIARDLLMYRYHTLDKARKNARRVKLAGALYPWRTINGDEASGFFMGSTVQYHIDADITYAIYLYDKTAADPEFIYDYGAEIVMETARMWNSRGSYIKMKENKFCINEVCGPDEYKPGVNNNCYTNYMAKFNLEYALEIVDYMKEEVPDKYKRLKKKIDLSCDELQQWQEAANKMYLPYNKELKIYPQDDSFLYKDPIDISSIPQEEFPLVRNWHPLVIWRYQLIKQADVLLLMLLLGDKFTREEKKRNYDYYEPRTTHDSSLSPSIHSIIASEIDYFEEAYYYFCQTARLDLDDYNQNAYQGIHTACMGSTWMALVQGFAGMRNYNGKLYFNPYLPDKWQAYEFKLRYRKCQLLIRVDRQGVLYKLIEGDKLIFNHCQQDVLIKRGESNVLNKRH